MATYIEMPKLSDTMTEGTLVKWRKKDGEKVEIGDVIAEVETDKATMEMEAFDDGILHKRLVPEGQKVPIGSKIALLLAAGEEPPAEGTELRGAQKPEAAAPAATTPAKGERASEAKSGAVSNAGARASSPDGGRIKISPLARKLARERGIDVAALTGSGPGGRIVARDVEQGSESPRAKVPSPAAAPALPMQPGDERIPLSGMRRVIAERLLASKTTIPHFYLHVEVDAGPLMKLRAEANEIAEGGGGTKLTVNDFILKAVVAAVERVPAVNASFAGDAIIRYGKVNLSFAVAVEDGLVTPVIREAETKSLREISEAVKDLAGRARSKKLKPEEYQGGTITVSNLGSYGVESFAAIINPPQSMIISVGAIVKKPVVTQEGEIVAGQRMNLGLSADHRVVDGALGAQYLAELRRLIENPALMLL